MRSPGDGVSPTGARPSELAIQARACSGPSPRAARSERVRAPWRLARRRPSGPSTSGPQVPEGEWASGAWREASIEVVLLAVPSLLSGWERLVGGGYGIQTRTGDSEGREARTTFLTPRRQSSRVMTEASDILRPGWTPVIRAAVLAICGTLASEPCERARANALGVMLWP